MDADERSTATGSVLSRLLLALIGLAIVWAVATWASGGIDWEGGWLRVRSRDPLRPALAAIGLTLAYLVSCRKRFTSDLDWIARHGARRAAVAAAAIALAVAGIAWSSTSVVAGGADQYGYVSQAYLWLEGNLTVPQPLVRTVPWPFADLTFTPLGYRPAIGGAALVPTYAPGLPMLMAIGAAIAGDCGPFLIVPLAGGLAIWLTYRLGRQLWSPWQGLTGALLLATSPAFVFMLMWPMSDVPVATSWLAATASAVSRGRWQFLRTGVLISAAILVRPNLVPVALPFFVWALRGEGSRARRLQQLAWLNAGLLPGVLVIAVLHTHLYGAPWRSGYGGLETLYAWSYLLPNLSRYPRWLLETETPLILAMVAPIVSALRRGARASSGADPDRPSSDPDRRSEVLLFTAVIALIWLSYLFYIPFNDWWYLRFLLPTFPLMLILAVRGGAMLAARLRRPLGVMAVVLITVGWLIAGVSRIASDRMLAIGEGELVYVRVAQFVVDHLPPNALLISMQHSGSLRYYAGRPTLRYDWLLPEWRVRALDALIRAGFRPFYVLDEWEEPLVRKRFEASAKGEDVLGCLVARETRAGGTRIFDPLRGQWCGPVRIDPEVSRPCRRPLAMTALTDAGSTPHGR